MRVYEIAAGSTSLEGLGIAQRPVPEPGPGQVLVKVRAASLNYRDIAVATGNYFAGPVDRDTIPLSDGAGTVEAVGDGVVGIAVGDRVAATFSQPPHGAPLGSPLDGVLTEYALFDQGGVVPIADDLGFEEAATLPCAGVTAWNALIAGKCVKPGDTVLTLGTGGVSILALQLAKAAGARVIITSSSDEKLERARALGADEGINYRTTPEWAAAVLELTGGQGADHIIELGGAGTLPQSYQCIAPEGEIALIGVLAPPEGNLSPHPLMIKGATLRGIFVGNVDQQSQFGGLNRAIAANGIRPVIDEAFDFDQAVDAYKCMAEARHLGKIIVRIG